MFGRFSNKVRNRQQLTRIDRDCMETNRAVQEMNQDVDDDVSSSYRDKSLLSIGPRQMKADEDRSPHSLRSLNSGFHLAVRM